MNQQGKKTVKKRQTDSMKYSDIKSVIPKTNKKNNLPEMDRSDTLIDKVESLLGQLYFEKKTFGEIAHANFFQS